MSPLHQKSWAKENGKGASHGVSRLGFGVNFAHYLVTYATLGGASQMALEVKNLLANAGDIRDLGSIPGSRRSLKEGLATSNILAWRIPRTEEPGGLQPKGS